MKKIVKTYCSILILLLLITACTATRKMEKNQILVKGKIDTVAGAVYYVSSFGNPQIADTIQLDNKKRLFFKTKSQEPIPVQLSIANTNHPEIVGNIPYYYFWAEPGMPFYFKAGPGRNNFTSKKGSSIQMVADSMENVNKKISEQRKEIVRRSLRNNVISFSDADKVTYDSLGAVEKDLEEKYIQNHPSSFYSAYLLSANYRFDPQAYPVVNKLYQNLSPEIKSTPTGKKIKTNLDVQSTWQIGKNLPDFIQNDTAGNPMKLSSLKGKYVLVDFWASWCGPCRAENPAVLRAYQKYHAKGFEILAVSLDDKRTNWLKAISDDKLNWIHVSDLKGWRNEVADQYNIHSIPDNFLLDKNGKILARGLRGDALEKKLEELL